MGTGQNIELEEIDISSKTNINQISFSNLNSDSKIILPSKAASKAFKSLVWNWFILDPEDHTNAICQVAGCPYPLVSRGRNAKYGKQGLTTSGMRRHLLARHGKKV